MSHQAQPAAWHVAGPDCIPDLEEVEEGPQEGDDEGHHHHEQEVVVVADPKAAAPEAKNVSLSRNTQK